MEQQRYYKDYPARIVLVSNIVSLSIYFIGGFLLYQIGFLWLLLYLAYIFILELRLLKGHCVDCYYFGRTCAFGKGKLSSFFFKRRNPKNFCQNKMTWKNIIPDFLILIIPATSGFIALLINFNWFVLILLVLLIFLGFSGNALVRGRLTCKYCKQRELGCPAQKLFEKSN